MELAWAAGFFDGEGSARCTQTTEGRRLDISIGQIHREPLERFHQAVGGIGVVCGPYIKGSSRQPMFFYKTYGWRDAKAVFALILPLVCSIKRDQIEAAIHLFDERPLKRQAPSRDGTYSICQRGHVFDRDGVYVRPDGGRECRPCRRQRQKAWEQQKLTARNAVASTMGKRGEEYAPAIES